MYRKDQRLEIGRRVQQIRGTRDQRTFAEAIGSVQQTISKYERGEIPRSWLFLARLVAQENIDLGWVLTGHAGRAGGEGVGEGLETNGGEKAGRPGREAEETFAPQGERAVSRF